MTRSHKRPMPHIIIPLMLSIIIVW
jgi:hypothetical protein